MLPEPEPESCWSDDSEYKCEGPEDPYCWYDEEVGDYICMLPEPIPEGCYIGPESGSLICEELPCFTDPETGFEHCAVHDDIYEPFGPEIGIDYTDEVYRPETDNEMYGCKIWYDGCNTC
jgi:hypothetical protein